MPSIIQNSLRIEPLSDNTQSRYDQISISSSSNQMNVNMAQDCPNQNTNSKSEMASESITSAENDIVFSDQLYSWLDMSNIDDGWNRIDETTPIEFEHQLNNYFNFEQDINGNNNNQRDSENFVLDSFVSAEFLKQAFEASIS